MHSEQIMPMVNHLWRFGVIVFGIKPVTKQIAKNRTQIFIDYSCGIHLRSQLGVER